MPSVSMPFIIAPKGLFEKTCNKFSTCLQKNHFRSIIPDIKRPRFFNYCLSFNLTYLSIKIMKAKIITIAIFATIILSSFYFGYERLTNFSGVDEPYWSYGRVPNFWNAIKTHQWKKTNICDKPGIPLAAISGAGLPFINGNLKSLKSLRFDPKTPEQVTQIRDAYFRLRLPVFLFTLLSLPLFYFLIKKLLGQQTAKFATIFIGFSPVLLGISPPDARLKSLLLMTATLQLRQR